jgi:hypothetical protein
MSTTPWIGRPPEQARLLNPAFIGATIWSCARGYASVDDRGLPYALAFVAVPVVLHKATREALPRTTRTSMVSWLAENPRAQVGFPDRARALVPSVKEAVLFASNGILMLQEARLSAGDRPRSMARFVREATDEVRACIKKAEFVGKWFAGSGHYTTVMALWGVAP